MSESDFAILLQGAVAGRHENLEMILQMYMPLINKHSYIKNTMDEDLRQYLMIHIALNISKFII